MRDMGPMSAPVKGKFPGRHGNGWRAVRTPQKSPPRSVGGRPAAAARRGGAPGQGSGKPRKGLKLRFAEDHPPQDVEADMASEDPVTPAPAAAPLGPSDRELAIASKWVPAGYELYYARPFWEPRHTSTHAHLMLASKLGSIAADAAHAPGELAMVGGFLSGVASKMKASARQQGLPRLWMGPEKCILVDPPTWSQLVGSIPYKEAEWRTRAARFCDSKMFCLSSSAHAAGLWEDGIHGLWELAMQREFHVDCSCEYLASTVGVLEMPCSAEGFPLVGSAAWNQSRRLRRLVLELLVQASTCAPPTDKVEPEKKRVAMKSPFEHLIAALRKKPKLVNDPGLMHQVHAYLKRMKWDVNPPQADNPQSPLLAAAPKLTARDLVSHAVHASLSNQIGRSIQCLLAPTPSQRTRAGYKPLAQSAANACVAALGTVWSLAASSATRGQLVDLGAHKRVLAVMLAAARCHVSASGDDRDRQLHGWWARVRNNEEVGEPALGPELSALHQQLMVYATGALSVLLCDPRARASLAVPPGATDRVAGVDVQLPAGVLEVPRKSAAGHSTRIYQGRLAKRRLQVSAEEAATCLPGEGPRVASLPDYEASSAHRAMSQECLRVVGAAGFLSDGEGEDAEMKEYVDADLVSTKANARSMVTSDADEISGFNILGMFACLLPDARVPEVELGTRLAAARALCCALARGKLERDAFCSAGGVQWIPTLLRAPALAIQKCGIYLYSLLAEHKLQEKTPSGRWRSMRASIKRWSFMVENKKVAAIKSSDECHALALDRQILHLHKEVDARLAKGQLPKRPLSGNIRNNARCPAPQQPMECPVAKGSEDCGSDVLDYEMGRLYGMLRRQMSMEITVITPVVSESIVDLVVKMELGLTIMGQTAPTTAVACIAMIAAEPLTAPHLAMEKLIQLLIATAGEGAEARAMKQQVAGVLALLAVHDAPQEQSLMSPCPAGSAAASPAASFQRRPSVTASARDLLRHRSFSATQSAEKVKATYSVLERAKAPWQLGGKGLCRERLTQSGCVAAMLRVIRDTKAEMDAGEEGSVSACVSAAACVMSLAATDPVPEWASWDLHLLLEFLHVDHLLVKLYITSTIWILAQQPSNRKNMFDAGCVDTLLEYLHAWQKREIEKDGTEKPSAAQATEQGAGRLVRKGSRRIESLSTSLQSEIHNDKLRFDLVEWTAAALWQILADQEACTRVAEQAALEASKPRPAAAGSKPAVGMTLVHLLKTGTDRLEQATEATRVQYCNVLRVVVNILLLLTVYWRAWAASFHRLGGAEMLVRMASWPHSLPELRGAAALMYLQIYAPFHGCIHEVLPGVGAQSQSGLWDSMFGEFLMSSTLFLEEVGARGLSALAVTPQNKTSMVKSQSHVALVAVMHKYVQGDQSILMEDVIRYNRTHSVLDDQATREGKSRGRQGYSVFRLVLKALLNLSDVIVVQEFICSKGLATLLEFVGSECYANELRVLASKILGNLARRPQNYNRLYKGALALRVLHERRGASDEPELPQMQDAAHRASPTKSSVVAAPRSHGGRARPWSAFPASSNAGRGRDAHQSPPATSHCGYGSKGRGRGASGEAHLAVPREHTTLAARALEFNHGRAAWLHELPDQSTTSDKAIPDLVHNMRQRLAQMFHVPDLSKPTQAEQASFGEVKARDPTFRAMSVDASKDLSDLASQLEISNRPSRVGLKPAGKSRKAAASPPKPVNAGSPAPSSSVQGDRTTASFDGAERGQSGRRSKSRVSFKENTTAADQAHSLNRSGSDMDSGDKASLVPTDSTLEASRGQIKGESEVAGCEGALDEPVQMPASDAAHVSEVHPTAGMKSVGAGRRARTEVLWHEDHKAGLFAHHEQPCLCKFCCPQQAHPMKVIVQQSALMVDEFQFKLCEKDGVGFHLNMQDNTISRGSLAGFLHVEGCRVCGDLFKHYELPDGQRAHFCYIDTVATDAGSVLLTEAPPPPGTLEDLLKQSLPSAESIIQLVLQRPLYAPPPPYRIAPASAPAPQRHTLPVETHDCVSGCALYGVLPTFPIKLELRQKVVPVDTLDGDAPSSVAASEASATSSGARQALNLPTSIYGPRKEQGDARDFYNAEHVFEESFQIDWERMCTRASFSHAVLDRGGAGELSEIKSGLYKHYAAMCRMFTYYCARVDKSGDHLHIVMQDGAYRLFICEFGLVDENGHGPCTMSVLEDIFEEAWGEHELQAEDSSEQAGSTSDTELKGFLVRFQFLEVMVRIAIAKYVKVMYVHDVSIALDLLLASGVPGLPPAALLDTDVFRRDPLYTKPVEVVLRRHQPLLEAIYFKYSGLSAGESTSRLQMSPLQRLMVDSELIGEEMSRADVLLNAAWSSLAMSDEFFHDTSELATTIGHARISSMNTVMTMRVGVKSAPMLSFVDFLEFLGRISAILNPHLMPDSDEDEDSAYSATVPLARRLEGVLQVMFANLCCHYLLDPHDQNAHVDLATALSLPVSKDVLQHQINSNNQLSRRIGSFRFRKMIGHVQEGR